jgi:hypothetical protein
MRWSNSAISRHAREREALPVHERRLLAVVLGVAQAALLRARAERPCNPLLAAICSAIGAWHSRHASRIVPKSRRDRSSSRCGRRGRLALVHHRERTRRRAARLADRDERHRHRRAEHDQQLRARPHRAPPSSTAP